MWGKSGYVLDRSLVYTFIFVHTSHLCFSFRSFFMSSPWGFPFLEPELGVVMVFFWSQGVCGKGIFSCLPTIRLEVVFTRGTLVTRPGLPHRAACTSSFYLKKEEKSLKGRIIEKRNRVRDLPSTGSLPEWLQWPELYQAEAKESQELASSTSTT